VGNVCRARNHNVTVGWPRAAHAVGLLHVVVRRDAADPPRLVQRLRITRDVALQKAAGYHEVMSRGRGGLSRLFSLILFGDLVSVYLAYLNGVDPYPVAVIDEVKERLEREG